MWKNNVMTLATGDPGPALSFDGTVYRQAAIGCTQANKARVLTADALSELDDAPAYWTTGHDSISGSYFTNSNTDPHVRVDAPTMSKRVEGFATLLRSFGSVAETAYIRNDNYSPIPADDCWTLEMYTSDDISGTGLNQGSCHRRGSWFNHASAQYVFDGLPHVANPATGFTSNTPAYGDPSVNGVGDDFRGNYLLKSEVTVNRYPFGNALITMDLAIRIKGTTTINPPSYYSTHGNNWFVSFTSPRSRGGQSEVAAGDQANRFSWCWNASEHTASSGANAIQWESASSLLLHYGENTVIDFDGTALDGRRFAAGRTGTVGTILASGTGYRRFTAKSFSFEHTVDEDAVLNYDEGGVLESRTCGTAELLGAPKTYIDMQVGRYFHGGHGNEFQVSTPKFG